MAKSNAMSVSDYLSELPDDRRAVVSAVRDVVLKNLPAGYVETMNWGMISYEIPLEIYPDTYNGRPLSYAALAAQKNHYALYLSSVYQDPKREETLKRGFAAAGKKLDMGKSCLRFRKLADLPLDVIATIIADCLPEQFIEAYESVRRRTSTASRGRP